ncbi:Vacuolar protein sorting-associated protein 8 [Hypoxylon texense]
MVKRDANTTFDMGFEAKDVTLFDGSWQALGQTFSLSLACVECRTWGTLVASAAFPDDLEELIGDLSDLNPLNDASLSVGFQGVGALVDLALTTGANGQFTLPLFVTETPLGITGPGFQIGVVFGVDLVLGITGEVTTEGGFQVAIPDDSLFTIPLDPTVANVGKFDGVSASLLPLTASAPANVTLALRLRVQAGLELPSSPLLDAKALAGAFINIPEITLGEQFTTSPTDGSNCLLPATAEINVNAGVFVDVGADIGDFQLIDDFNPTLSTTLFSAAASTCFITVGQDTATATTTASAVLTTGVAATGTGGAADACPVALTTETVATTTAFTITSCAAPIANCPASLTQVIVVSSPVTETATRCPVSLNNNNNTTTGIVIPPYANTTTAAAGITTTLGAGAISLTSLTAPVTNTLTVDPTVVPPDVPSITGTANGGGSAVTNPALAVSTPAALSTVYVTVTPTTCAC